MKRDVLVRLLSNHAPLPEHKRDPWLDQARTIELAPEDFLLNAGQPSQHIYIVAEGLVRAVYITPAGKEFSKEFYWCPDTIFCLPTLIGDQALPYGIQACEKAKVVALPLLDYQKLIREDSHWQKYHVHHLERHIRFKESKEALLLTHSTEEKVKQVYADFPNFVRRVPAVMLATYIGITPESLSRIKKRLKL